MRASSLLEPSNPEPRSRLAGDVSQPKPGGSRPDAIRTGTGQAVDLRLPDPAAAQSPLPGTLSEAVSEPPELGRRAAQEPGRLLETRNETKAETRDETRNDAPLCPLRVTKRPETLERLGVSLRGDSGGPREATTLPKTAAR